MSAPFNFQHLFYLWQISKEGSISAAAKKVKVSQPAISQQIQILEAQLGRKLLIREGRNVGLSEYGRVAIQYADQIFSLGHELSDIFHRDSLSVMSKLHLGIVDSVPKLITYKITSPLLSNSPAPQLICYEDTIAKLAGMLISHQIDLIISDRPLPEDSNIKAYSHFLGKTNISLFCSNRLLKAYSKNFPKTLNLAPFCLPLRGSPLSQALASWFRHQNILPHVVAESQDSALIKVFGQAGLGIFAGPTILKKEICRQYQVRQLAELKEISESYYAISIEKKIRHPSVIAITQNARQEFFT